MKFRTSLKILFKSQMVATGIFFLNFAIVMLISNIYETDYWERDSIGRIIANGLFISLYFLAFSAVVYYTIGLAVHRLFLRFKLYELQVTLLLSLLLAIMLMQNRYIHMAFSFMGLEELSDIISTLILILPQLLVVRYLTLKELRKNKQPVISSEA